jgi:hypothetical protein
MKVNPLDCSLKVVGAGHKNFVKRELLIRNLQEASSHFALLRTLASVSLDLQFFRMMVLTASRLRDTYLAGSLPIVRAFSDQDELSQWVISL